MSSEQQYPIVTKFERIFKKISLGRYNSVLSYKGESRHGSVLGGTLTIAGMITYVIFTIITFQSIFKRDHYNLDTYTQSLDALQFGEVLSPQSTCQDCFSFTNNDMLAFIQGHEYDIMSTNPQELMQCSQFNASLVYLLSGSNQIVNITQLTLIANTSRNCKYLLFPVSNIFTSLENANFTLADTALMDLQSDDTEDIYSRMSIIFSGLQPQHYVQPTIQQDTNFGQSGTYSGRHSIDSVQIGEQLLEVSQVFVYGETTSLQHTQYSKPQGNILFQFQDENVLFTTSTDVAIIDFSFYRSAHLYYRYPDTFASGLVRVGGLLSMLSIGLFILYLKHKRQFEEKISADSRQSNSQSAQTYDVNSSLIEDNEAALSSQTEQNDFSVENFLRMSGKVRLVEHQNSQLQSQIDELKHAQDHQAALINEMRAMLKKED